MSWRHWVLLFAMLAIIWSVFLFPAIPQNEAYHNFADHRRLFGVPNLFNVASNVFFLVVGSMGIWFVRTTSVGDGSPFSDSVDRWAYLIFFIAVAATAFGSAYYHLHPDDHALVWDRLPMAVGFLSLLAAVVCERTTPKNGLPYLVLLPAWGAGTVLYWRATEQGGQGDLRPYVIAQFGSLIAILLLMALFRPRFTRGADLLVSLAIYGGAKAFEAADRTIFVAGGIVSGHTLKHVAAAISAYWILRMLRLRAPLPARAT
ncbi:MAG: hypothetical protein WB987_01900 [Candidatus Acidiferrales bacterium]